MQILGTRAVDSRELFEKRIRDVATLMAMVSWSLIFRGMIFDLWRRVPFGKKSLDRVLFGASRLIYRGHFYFWA